MKARVWEQESQGVYTNSQACPSRFPRRGAGLGRRVPSGPRPTGAVRFQLTNGRLLTRTPVQGGPRVRQPPEHGLRLRVYGGGGATPHPPNGEGGRGEVGLGWCVRETVVGGVLEIQ